jgi:hypothetical protein
MQYYKRCYLVDDGGDVYEYNGFQQRESRAQENQAAEVVQQLFHETAHPPRAPPAADNHARPSLRLEAWKRKEGCVDTTIFKLTSDAYYLLYQIYDKSCSL